MAVEPWSVQHTRGDEFEFTNQTGERAVMITMEGLGFPLQTEVPHPLAEGESFKLNIPSSGNGIRVYWTKPGIMSNHTWVYTR